MFPIKTYSINKTHTLMHTQNITCVRYNTVECYHLRKISHMTLTSPNEKWMRFADILRHFCHFLLWWGEFCFDVVGNFEPKKITPNCNALAKSIISYLWGSYFTFVFSWQCKTMLFTNKKACSDVIGACA